jgi:hypothetical protein
MKNLSFSLPITIWLTDSKKRKGGDFSTNILSIVNILIRRRLRHFESIGGTIDCENEERDKKFKN